MARFRAAGLVTLGLTTVPEMAISFSTESVRYGPTRNPWDLERGVGGSSGKTRGVDRLYLQVEEENTPARHLYVTKGFTHSHGYHYRTKPQP